MTKADAPSDRGGRARIYLLLLLLLLLALHNTIHVRMPRLHPGTAEAARIYSSTMVRPAGLCRGPRDRFDPLEDLVHLFLDQKQMGMMCDVAPWPRSMTTTSEAWDQTNSLQVTALLYSRRQVLHSTGLDFRWPGAWTTRKILSERC